MTKRTPRQSAIVDYRSITTADRNPIKRYLQNRRLFHAMRFLLNKETANFSGQILDYGSGNAELLKRLQPRYPKARLYGYEPAEGYRRQARENVEGLNTIQLVGLLEELNQSRFDYIFCLEVFEHLPEKQIREALQAMYRLLKDEGTLIIGIPIETYLPALLKGLFRMTRRYGEVDALPLNILGATLGKSIAHRPLIEIEPGLPYYPRHIGFNHRVFEKMVADSFIIINTYGSPVTFFPDFLNFEKYLIIHKK